MQTSTFLPSVSPCISSLSSISCCDEMIRFHFAIFSSVTQIPPFIYHSGRLSKLCRNFPTVSSQPQIALKVATRASNIRANPAPTKVPRVRKANRLLFEDPDCLWVLVSPLGSANTQEVACFVHHWEINGYNRAWHMTGTQWITIQWMTLLGHTRPDDQVKTQGKITKLS